MGNKNPALVTMHTDEELYFDISNIYYHHMTGFNMLTAGKIVRAHV